jgi:SHS2 domain-containing protein
MFDHTADIGVEIYGRTRKELFANAAVALFDILIQDSECTGGKKRRVRERMKIRTVEGADPEDLLVNYLRELLFLFNGSGCVVNRGIILRCSKKKVVSRLVVEPYDPERHLIKTELKAVTYHGLRVERTRSGWKARVIFDV